MLTPADLSGLESQPLWRRVANSLLVAFYSMLLLVQLITNINNPPKRMRTVHWFCTLAFGCYQYVFLILVGW